MFRGTVFLLLRLFARLRYRVTFTGTDCLPDDPKRVLLLPSHPGFLDPPLIILFTWGRLRLRPLVDDLFYRAPVLNLLMRLVRAIPIFRPKHQRDAHREDSGQAIAAVIDALQAGDNCLMVASGHTQRRGIEVVGMARATSDVLQAVPDCVPILARVEGMWGSSFTWAYTSKQPKLLLVALAGVLRTLAAFTFFLPRRKINIALAPLMRETLPSLERQHVNRALELYYNPSGQEQPPVFVPYHLLFGRRTRDYILPVEEASLDLGAVTDETRAAIVELLAERGVENPHKLGPDTRLEDVGLDSIVRLELALTVEDRFGTAGGEIPRSIGELWALAQGVHEATPITPPPLKWFAPSSVDREKPEVLAETVPEAFVAMALRMRKRYAVADDLSGALTYERMLIGARVLARRIRRLPGKHVGLMLPASVAADVTFMAIHLAGKIAVLMNWTTGEGNLAVAARTVGLSHVLTSKRFIERVEIKVPGAELLYLEELRASVGKLELLSLLLSQKLTPFALRGATPRPDPNAPAAVLFTSGSEKAPKAVPLSHANVLTNLRGVLSVVHNITRGDSVMGFLPMFHSFGITITTLLPLLSGVRVVHHPDPTDAGPIARKIGLYHSTILAATPTFLGYILDRARPGELDSLTIAVTGAERCPPRLREKARALAPNAEILEGYGITECSPVVSANPPGAVRDGTIGLALPGVELRIVNADTLESIPQGERGMLLVHGPSVFGGYLPPEGEPPPDPFVELDGKRWFVTGDLVVQDADGYLTFHGRLKRFLKIAGEMVSLPALEAVFTERYAAGEDGPLVAVEGIEAGDVEDRGDDASRNSQLPHRLALFTTPEVELTLSEANAMLKEAGFAGVLRLTDIRAIDAIPVLGTGKTDYKILRHELEAERTTAVQAT